MPWKEKQKPAIPCGITGFSGAARQIRTADLILTNGILLIMQYFLAWSGHLYCALPLLHCILSACFLTPHFVALVVK